MADTRETRDAVRQRIIDLAADAVPDPSLRLTLLLAVSDFGYACASEAIEDLMRRQRATRRVA